MQKKVNHAFLFQADGGSENRYNLQKDIEIYPELHSWMGNATVSVPLQLEPAHQDQKTSIHLDPILFTLLCETFFLSPQESMLQSFYVYSLQTFEHQKNEIV